VTDGITIQNGQAMPIPGYAKAQAGIEGAKAGAVSASQGMYDPINIARPDGTNVLTSKTNALTQPGGGMEVRDPNKDAFNFDVNKGLLKRVEDGAQTAMGAVKSLSDIDRIRAAFDTGKINLGPGSSISSVRDQIAETMGFASQETKERLASTRTAIQGFAKLSLNGLSQMGGTGPLSDKDVELVKSASSGNIDSLTAPELKRLMDVLEKASRFTIDEHNRNTSKLLPNNPNVGQYFVQPPPAYKPPEAGGSPAKISNQAQYDALPSGSTYLDPQGQIRRKK